MHATTRSPDGLNYVATSERRVCSCPLTLDERSPRAGKNAQAKIPGLSRACT